MSDNNITDEKRNELQQLLVGEGYTPDEAAEMAADGAAAAQVDPAARERLDKILTSMRETAIRLNRPRWVKPADGAVDFVVEQTRRRRAAIDAECEADQARCDNVEGQLIAIAAASGLPNITTCMLSALIQVLKARDDSVTLKQIKTEIAATLGFFFDERIGDSE